MEPKDIRATTALPGATPKTDGEPASSGALDVNIDESTARNFLILVVDDSADNVAVLSLALQQQGYRVVTATDGEEAISVAALTQPNLILMDISMPRLDGLGATRKIHELEKLRNVPVIAVTAFSETQRVPRSCRQ